MGEFKGEGYENEMMMGKYDDQERGKIGELLKKKQEYAKVPFDGEFADQECRNFFLDRMQEIVEDCHADGMDEVVFLDKGARLLGGFFRKVWEVKHPDEEAPSVSFVNIGSEKARNYEGKGYQALQYMDDAAYEREISDVKAQLLQSFGDKFDDKWVLLVDELCFEGRALNYAYQLFCDTYPNSKIHATWFEIGEAGNNELYDREEEQNVPMYSPPARYPASYHGKINLEKFMKYENGVVEAPDKRALFAMPWNQQEFEGETEEGRAVAKKEYSAKVHHWHDQMTKLALELL